MSSASLAHSIRKGEILLTPQWVPWSSRGRWLRSWEILVRKERAYRGQRNLKGEWIGYRITIVLQNKLPRTVEQQMNKKLQVCYKIVRIIEIFIWNNICSFIHLQTVTETMPSSCRPVPTKFTKIICKRAKYKLQRSKITPDGEAVGRHHHGQASIPSPREYRPVDCMKWNGSG